MLVVRARTCNVVLCLKWNHPVVDILVSTSDEGASSHRSQDCCGNMLETKKRRQYKLSSKTLQDYLKIKMQAT